MRLKSLWAHCPSTGEEKKVEFRPDGWKWGKMPSEYRPQNKVNYIHETLNRHYKTLKSADWSDIERMAFIGDRLIEAAFCVNLSKVDKKSGEWQGLIQNALSNENFAKYFQGKCNNNRHSEWSKGTVIEACFYLDYINHGMDFLIKGAKNIPFKIKPPPLQVLKMEIKQFMPKIGAGKAHTFNQNAVFLAGQGTVFC